MIEIPICYYVNMSQVWTTQLALFDETLRGSMDLQIDYFLQHHTTTQGRVKHTV